MAKTRTSKRAERTCQLLRDALISLIVERGYDEVTVQHILDRAGVGRSTFYVYFRDKEELFRSSLENMRAGLIHRWRTSLASESKPLGGLAFALPLLRHIDSNRHLHRPIVRGQSGMIFDRQMRLMLAELIRMDLAPGTDSSQKDVLLEGTIQFLVGAFMSLLTWWMEYNPRLSPEEINRIFLQLALGGLNSARKSQAHTP
ncbi:MAG TPA: TetR/AcrR family transcriptional regulator [Blastocatellia bacterium]|nr:TetR/AcrR family transcriptional regulator [Blastocatellia bacterium]